MIVQFLGTGTSTGVPEIGCTCKVCTSADERDKRLRCSVWVETDGKNILIDCSPDFRQQMLRIPFRKIDGVLITHEHYDHVGGIDDLRPYCLFGALNIYLEPSVAKALSARMPYCFGTHKYMGVPEIVLNEIHYPHRFQVAGIEIIPIRAMHYKLPILGFRIGDFAYITDLKTLPETELPKLENLSVLVLNALRHEEHISHANLQQAIELSKKINPHKTYFTHFSHQMGLHAEESARLPDNIFFAFDELELNI